MGLTSNLTVLREIWDKFPELFYKITKLPERSEAGYQKVADFWHFCAYLGYKNLVIDPISYSESTFPALQYVRKKMHRGSPRLKI
jgi:hypothetical protein